MASILHVNSTREMLNHCGDEPDQAVHLWFHILSWYTDHARMHVHVAIVHWQQGLSVRAATQVRAKLHIQIMS